VIPETLQKLLWLLTGGPDASSGDRFLHLALVACSLFACGQLLTMLGTRWGDTHAMLKSFFLSLLLHLCLGLGWASVVDELPGSPRPFADEPERFAVQQRLDASPEAAPKPTPGNTPLWQQPLSVPNPQVLRTQRAAPVEAPTPEPLPTPEAPTVTPIAPDVATVSTAPSEPEAPPQVTPAVDQTAATAPVPVVADLPPMLEPQARPEANAQPASVRQSMSRTPSAEPFLPTEASRGSAQRAAPLPDDLALSTPLPLDDAPTVPRPDGPPSDTIARKASPAATALDDPQLGATSAASPGAGDVPRFTRSNSQRATTGEAVAAVTRPEPFRPNFDASSERAAAARQSLSSPGDIAPQPSVVRSTPGGGGGLASSAAAATTYRLRNLQGRQDVALKNGGSESSERAVEEALAWLARHQEEDGYWDADAHGGGARETRPIEKDRPPGGTQTDPGLTGLAILSFLGAGYTHEEGDYTETVSKAIEWLISQQRTDGYLGGKSTYYDQMYCHGIATYALAEAYGMQSDPSSFPALREAVAQGVWYITQTQNKDGGWRYRVGADESDMSIFGWQLMALKSAELAGLEIPDQTRRGMIQFLRQRSRGGRGGLASYKEKDDISAAMTAEAFFCKQMYGLKRASDSSKEAADYLRANLPQMSTPNEYYWYYGTLSMFQYGGDPWKRWNESLRDILVRLQRKSGDNAGSWDPAGPWGSVGGRVYSTTLCVMSLEVYYRFLPLYRVGEE
jgi:hypothetical protein